VEELIMLAQSSASVPRSRGSGHGLLFGLAIGSAASGIVTLVLIVVARYCWRRGKPLQEP
jgi:hypothetical protein